MEFRNHVIRLLRHLGVLASGEEWTDFPDCLREEKRWRRWKSLLDRLEFVYGIFVDDESRDWLVKVFVARLLGTDVAPIEGPWDDWDELSFPKPDSPRFGGTIETGYRDTVLEEVLIQSGGGAYRAFLTGKRPNALFDLDQYSLPEHGVAVKEGEIVIDGGACWGDSAVYFAHQCGESGEVHSFEFLPGNLGIFDKQLSLNEGFSDRVKLHRHPLWSSSDIDFVVREDGPATRVYPVSETGSETGDLVVTSLSIDDLVDRENLERVDFIKMDIEGAEMEALKGAEGVLCKYKPKCAVCVYHQPQDYVRLLEYIDSLKLGYQFALRHFTKTVWETVLFAWVDEGEK